MTVSLLKIKNKMKFSRTRRRPRGQGHGKRGAAGGRGGKTTTRDCGVVEARRGQDGEETRVRDCAYIPRLLSESSSCRRQCVHSKQSGIRTRLVVRCPLFIVRGRLLLFVHHCLLSFVRSSLLVFVHLPLFAVCHSPLSAIFCRSPVVNLRCLCVS